MERFYEGFNQVTKGIVKAMDGASKLGNKGADKMVQGINKQMDGTVSCPKCNSLNITHTGNQRKAFSAGKAVAGTLLAGQIGTLAGFAGKDGKSKWRCSDCGKTFIK